MCVRGNTSGGTLGPNSNYFGSAAFPMSGYEWPLSFFQVPQILSDWIQGNADDHKLHNNSYMEMFTCVIFTQIQGKSTDDKDLRCWQVYNGMYMKEPVLEGSSGWEDPSQGVARLLHRASWAAWRPLSRQVPMPWMDPHYCCPRNLPGSQTYKQPLPECSSSPWKVGSGHISRGNRLSVIVTKGHAWLPWHSVLIFLEMWWGLEGLGKNKKE